MSKISKSVSVTSVVPFTFPYPQPNLSYSPSPQSPSQSPPPQTIVLVSKQTLIYSPSAAYWDTFHLFLIYQYGEYVEKQYCLMENK